MNFYKHHLGDYDGATAHLSWDEDMAYTRLLRAYYRSEKPIPVLAAARIARATTKAQVKAIKSVLLEFFFRDGDVFRNKRADEEILSYQAQASTNRRIARQRFVNDSSTIGSPNQIPEPEPEKDKIKNTPLPPKSPPSCG